MDSKTLAMIAAVTLAMTTMMATQNNTDTFEQFKISYSKVYISTEEEAYRRAIFSVNEKIINEHNADKTQTYTKGINAFADLTQEEFKSIYLGFKPREVKKVEQTEEVSFIGDINWVTKGKVQRVKNQGQCGSCWAFSTCASCESLKAINENVIGDFSEQQLVDCSGSYGNNGCSGGLMDNGFKYFIATGICTEGSYAYTAQDGSCKVSQCTKDSFTISSYSDVSQGSTSGLKQRCDQQPVSIACDAQNWSSYSGGIFSNCGTSLDHGILLAGYTSSYWLVKNSWGASWGEQGYIRLAPGNTCGLANSASTPS